MQSTPNYSDKREKLKTLLNNADAVMIGAGAGLSMSAGFIYSGKRFHENFHDFEAEYGFHDMYSGGFYPYDTLEEYWAYWSRYIYINRYEDPPKPVYNSLYNLVKNKDYFVLTTNVDHCFQKAGFDKQRLFYTQGDYGLFQCCVPCHKKTYDNEALIRRMVAEQKRYENSDRTYTALPRMRKTDDDEPAFGRHVRSGSGLGRSLRQIRKICESSQKQPHSLLGARRRRQHSRYNQISVLAFYRTEQ